MLCICDFGAPHCYYDGMKTAPSLIRCYKCDTAKPPTEFYKSKNRRPYGLSSTCKLCFAERGKSLPKQKLTYEQNKHYTLRTKFRISLEQYQNMLSQQNYVCAICGEPETDIHPATGKLQALSVDHDPNCCPGKFSCGNCIRGLLCGRCNKGIGSLRHDPHILRSAINYLS